LQALFIKFKIPLSLKIFAALISGIGVHVLENILSISLSLKSVAESLISRHLIL
jgi:hypothetical protein